MALWGKCNVGKQFKAWLKIAEQASTIRCRLSDDRSDPA